jgi:hypothetical protein
MTYRITGLPADDFTPLFTLDDAALAERNAERVIATGKPGFPCRISLQDAEPGERLILLHHVSHDVATPYRSAYAIFVRPDVATAIYEDALPPVMQNRPIALRAFDATGRLRDAALAGPGEAEVAILRLFENADIAYIHAHNAAHGCFAARVDRS